MTDTNANPIEQMSMQSTDIVIPPKTVSYEEISKHVSMLHVKTAGLDDTYHLHRSRNIVTDGVIHNSGENSHGISDYLIGHATYILIGKYDTAEQARQGVLADTELYLNTPPTEELWDKIRALIAAMRTPIIPFAD